MKVAVIFGGKSTENYVSRLSATSVIKNMNKEKYEIVMIGITKDGKWYHYIGDVCDLSKEDWVNHVEPSVNGIATLADPTIDVIFPVLHGTNGEDGTVQGLFELLDKPYVGCGVLASAVSMDKAYTKIICEKEGIPQCKKCAFERYEIENDPEGCAEKAVANLGFPIFVKPSNAGSSFGVSKAKDKDALIEALKLAAQYDIRVLAEEFIDGREIECAVLGNWDLEVDIPGELVAANEFYDYDAKYFNNQSRTEVPADLTEAQREEVCGYAKRVFRCLDCKGLSRVDFFLERSTGRFLFNEINTLPGFTNISMYSMMWGASGLAYADLLDKLIALAFENYEAHKRNYF